ncbi:hypothetical protein V8E51_004608 [Hyaloscypha variabilis]|jgi:hypothetical protein
MLITSCLLRLALIMLLFGIPVLEVVACGRTRRQGEEKSMLRDSGTHMLHRGLARRGGIEVVSGLNHVASAWHM